MPLATNGDCVNKRAHWDGLLTERSKKFYDGTYTWKGTDGFWDAEGIYHCFMDPNDPEADPPTPRPVSPSSDYSSEIQDNGGLKNKIAVANMEKSVERCDSVTPDSTTQELGFNFTKGKKHTNTMSSIDVDVPTILLQGHEIQDHPNRERLLGQLEGILVGRLVGRGLTLENAHGLCGIHIADEVLAAVAAHTASHKDLPSLFIDSLDHRTSKGAPDGEKLRALYGSRGPTTLTASDHKVPDGSIPQEPLRLKQNNEGQSPLSDCPSDLSDWSLDDEVQKTTILNQHQALMKRNLDGSSKHVKQTRNTKSKVRGRSTTARARKGCPDSGGLSIPRRSGRSANMGAPSK